MNRTISRCALKGAAVSLMLVLLAGFAFAEAEDGKIGLDAGLELGILNDADDPVFAVIPNVVYENSFGPLDVYGELDYTIAFDDPASHGIYLEEELGYNLQLADPSVLSFIVNNNNTFYLAPSLEEGFGHKGVLEPGVKYTHTLDFGDLFFKASFPIGYMTYVKADDKPIEFQGKLGWASTFGLGLECTGVYAISPDAEFWGYIFLASYERDFFYGEVEFDATKDFKWLEIYPEIDISFKPWTFTARLEIYYADDEGSDSKWTINPFIGAKFSF